MRVEPMELVHSWKYAGDHDCDDRTEAQFYEDSIIGGWDDEFDSYNDDEDVHIEGYGMGSNDDEDVHIEGYGMGY